MPRLLNRNTQIPNGLRFLQPQTGWKPPKFASFDQIVQGLIRHRKGNPFLVQKHNLATDYDSVANEVDIFNARICEKMGWKQYIIIEADGGQPSAPFPQSRSNLLAQLEKVAAGGRVLVEWIQSGEEAVPAELANSRAAVCVRCPLNAKGDWTSFFTVPVSNKIREALEQRRSWNLSTIHDEDLHVCDACSCPLPLKVHMGLDRILTRIPAESLAALHPDCWIRKEREAKA